MTHPVKADPPPDAKPGICSSFSAYAEAQVIFQNTVSGGSITKDPGSQLPYPFVKSDGTEFNPINFPLVGNQKIFIKSSLSPDDGPYTYQVTGENCIDEAIRGVTVLPPAMGIKRAS
jgi:hypothetical protein